MKHRVVSIGIVSVLLVSVLAACGADSSPKPTATVVVTVAPTAADPAQPTATNAVEPTGEAPRNDVIPTEPPLPTSTLYAEDKPTPTPLTAVTCNYLNESTLSFQTFEELRAELHLCNEEFTWPEGYEIDPERMAFQPGWTGVGGGQTSGARLIVGLFNGCAWMTYWYDLTTAGDQEGADRALENMFAIYPMWGNGEPGSAYAEGIAHEYRMRLDKARLGDPSGLLEMLSWGDCRLYESLRGNP